MSIELALKRLGYTREWLELCVLSKSALLDQYSEILTSEDQNAEHYRCGTFAQFVKHKNHVTDLELNQILALKDNGPDECDLKVDRMLALIRADILTDIQVERLASEKEALEAPIQKLYLRTMLFKKISKLGLEACFEEVQSTKDSSVHEFVLGRSDLKPDHVRWLSEYGSNKKIRNVAGQLAASKRFRAST